MKKHVLVVDDSLVVRMDVRAALGPAGFDVTAVDNLAEASAALRAGPVALVVLDVVLPDGDGLDLVREIRASPATVDTPVVVITAAGADIAPRVRALPRGPIDFLPKPYDRAELVRRVRELCRATEPPPRAPSSPTLLAQGTAGGPRKVLVVDDSATYLHEIAERLRQEGYAPVTAESGERALALLATAPVDCVVLDLVLPGIDGVQTCQRIRALPNCARVPVLMLTGSDDKRAMANGLAAGVDDFVVKGESLGAVISRVDQLLRHKAIENETRSIRERMSSRAARHRAGDADAGALLQRVVMATGLSPLIGTATVERVLRGAGHDPQDFSGADLAQALPALRQALAVFASPGELEARMAALAALAREA